MAQKVDEVDKVYEVDNHPLEKVKSLHFRADDYQPHKPYQPYQPLSTFP